MNRIKSTYRLRVLRAAFLLAGLLLFGTQVSYKFYRNASASVCRHAPRHPHAIHGPRPSTHLTLDKRYDSGVPYGPVPPVFHFCYIETGNGAHPHELPFAMASCALSSPSPRAPPGILLEIV